jgi:hypothetical protein
MRNFLVLFGGIFLTLFLIVLISGRSAGQSFNYETTVPFDVSKKLLWEVIDDIDAYKINKKNIVSIEKKGFDGETIVSWKENYNFNISKNYEVLRKINEELLILKVENSFTKTKTIISFELTEDGTRSYLKTKEETESKNILWNGIRNLLGKDSYINSEIKWIRVGLYNLLINKK